MRRRDPADSTHFFQTAAGFVKCRPSVLRRSAFPEPRSKVTHEVPSLVYLFLPTLVFCFFFPFLNKVNDLRTHCTARSAFQDASVFGPVKRENSAQCSDRSSSRHRDPLTPIISSLLYLGRPCLVLRRVCLLSRKVCVCF